MAIIRFSALKKAVYATDPNGEFVDSEYSKRSRVGRLFEARDWKNGRDDHMNLKKNADNLYHYVEKTLQKQMKSYKKGQPVTIMVHGFLFNPKEPVTIRPEETDNAHGRIFHFQDGDIETEVRHHSSSWPLHLGFKKDEGESGLAVAYGWHSAPGLATSLLKRGQNHYQRAYDYAEDSAMALHHIFHALAKNIDEDIPIDIICHSLGSRVVIRLIAKIA